MRHMRGACIASVAGALGIVLALSGAGREPPKRDDAAAESLGWRLGTQAWTFRDRTAFEAVDAAHALGLKYIEFYPDQPLAKEFPGAKMNADLDTTVRAAVLTKLQHAGVKAVSFGVVKPANDDASVGKVFEFARAMGMETISCEPALDGFDRVERFCNQYSIKAAVHNHPKPSTYWDAQTVLDAVKSHGPRVGACADTGHWSRSGLVPVECLKKLEDRVIELHFKDIADGQDRPWGTGTGNARGMLEELRRQGFKGVILVEYETGGGAELEANVAKCIEFFDNACREIVAAETKRTKGKPPG